MALTTVWDDTGKRLFEGGCDRGMMFPMENNAYTKGVVWNGLTSVQRSPTGGDANDLYADNILYATLRSVEKEQGTIEAYTYPDAFALCDGSALMGTGVVAYGQTRKMFGLTYRTRVGNEVDGFDHGYKIHILYGCTVSPSSQQHETINADPNAITFSWEFSCVGVADTTENVSLKPISHIVIDSTTVDSAKLAAFEETLYDGNTLPLPAAVRAAFASTP